MYVHAANTRWGTWSGTVSQNGVLKLPAFDVAQPAAAPQTKTEAQFTQRDRELIVQSWKFTGGATYLLLLLCASPTHAITGSYKLPTVIIRVDVLQSAPPTRGRQRSE
jgi:hypothetical protein